MYIDSFCNTAFSIVSSGPGDDKNIESRQKNMLNIQRNWDQ